MPVALSAGLIVSEVSGASSWERSRPRVFLTAVFAPAPLGVARASFSSSARRASFSAFLRAASCFFCSASSLWRVLEGSKVEVVRWSKERKERTSWRLILRLYSILGLPLLLSLRFRPLLFGLLLRLS